MFSDLYGENGIILHEKEGKNMNRKLSALLISGMILAGCGTAVSSSSSNVQEKDYDVVVIGAGGAGISAAIEAYDKGADVIVLEKMAIAGGNTNRASGGMNASETSVEAENGIE